MTIYFLNGECCRLAIEFAFSAVVIHVPHKSRMRLKRAE